MRDYVLETDDILSLLFCFGCGGSLVCDSDPIFENACGLSSSLEFALTTGIPLRPQGTELCQFYIFIYFALLVVPISAELVDGMLVVLVVVVVNTSGVVVDLHLGTQLIDDFLLLFRLALSSLFLAFHGDIVNIHVSHIFLNNSLLPLLSFPSLHPLLGQRFLGYLNLLYQFLLIDDDRRFNFDDLHIRVVLILIEDLPLVILQPFLGVAVFGVDGSHSTVELLFSVF